MTERRFRRTLRLVKDYQGGWTIRQRLDGADGGSRAGSMTGRWHWADAATARTEQEGRDKLKAMRAEDAHLPTMDQERKQRARNPAKNKLVSKPDREALNAAAPEVAACLRDALPELDAAALREKRRGLATGRKPRTELQDRAKRARKVLATLYSDIQDWD